jgi:hypothetical protein
MATIAQRTAPRNSSLAGALGPGWQARRLRNPAAARQPNAAYKLYRGELEGRILERLMYFREYHPSARREAAYLLRAYRRVRRARRAGRLP